MGREIQAKITTVGRPLRVEVTLDGAWLERLKKVLRSMDVDSSSYSLARYLEELIEADVVYREAFSQRGPYLPRAEIAAWLQRRHANGPERRPARSGARR